MTEKQTISILRAISAVYSNFKPADMSDVVKVWTALFSADDANDVMTAVYVYMSEPHEFAPTVGRIRDIMFRLKEKPEPSEGEAWGMVVRAIRNGIYHSQEMFKGLPEIVQAAVGSADYLRSVAMSENVNMSVEQSLFSRRYKAIVEERQRYARLPEVVRLRLEGAGVKMLGVAE